MRTDRLRFSQKEKRIVIVLMLINSFALFVNYFGLSPKVDKDCGEAYIFTFTGREVVNYNYSYTALYDSDLFPNFWPFVDFTYPNYCAPFKGIFAYYDTSEFLVYTLLIFGIVIIRKIW
ncbi:hypothetical protein GGR22_000721 [Flavobacterium gossypii]|uniref:Uncharacterized protein n=1 Tax=Flavobacterium gossypii TaxID=1646119 RepID=A0ABR6DLP3_9FLAO|nr:hypothetical protein [Flavobacterium gossypii]MBA9072595.1 hypothetical protein [Flavobacterium gossypii]